MDIIWSILVGVAIIAGLLIVVPFLLYVYAYTIGHAIFTVILDKLEKLNNLKNGKKETR